MTVSNILYRIGFAVNHFGSWAHASFLREAGYRIILLGDRAAGVTYDD